jgi:hypothetical protein
VANDDEDCSRPVELAETQNWLFANIGTSALDDLARTKHGKRALFYFLFQMPHDSERVATFAGADESTLFHRLDGIAIGRQRA